MGQDAFFDDFFAFNFVEFYDFGLAAQEILYPFVDDAAVSNKHAVLEVEAGLDDADADGYRNEEDEERQKGPHIVVRAIVKQHGGYCEGEQYNNRGLNRPDGDEADLRALNYDFYFFAVLELGGWFNCFHAFIL